MNASQDISHFDDFEFCEQIQRAIDDAGYNTPTPIQKKAIPHVLDGVDLLAAAQTGTGKTAGFTLPILQLLSERDYDCAPGKPSCLILTPTRELAAQIHESVRLYGQHLPVTSLVVFGGVSINPQISALRKPVDILIATPGRLLDLVSQKKLSLNELETLVLDEADRMLDMGFIHDIRRIIKLLPIDRQTLMFSATFSDEIRSLARKMLVNAEEVSVAARNTASELVEQTVYHVDKSVKRHLLAELIHEERWHQVLVFTRTKHGADRLAKQLDKDGIEAMAIHGNKSQNARTRALQNFKDGSLNVLVATDIAARGLDIDQLPYVVNYELPNVSEDYVHRIGRTGRAGSEGRAISLVNAEEMKLLKGIEKLINRKIPVVTMDGFTGHNETVDEIVETRNANQAARKPRQRGRGGNNGNAEGRSRNSNSNSNSNSGQGGNRNSGGNSNGSGKSGNGRNGNNKNRSKSGNSGNSSASSRRSGNRNGNANGNANANGNQSGNSNGNRNGNRSVRKAS